MDDATSTQKAGDTLRYEVAYDAPAYDSGLKRHQLMFAADMIWFF